MDLKFLDLAAQAAATVNPHQTASNPRVGCVVVKEGQVIATGVHTAFGQAHAEVDALSKLIPGYPKNLATHPGMELSNSTVYITLEPCMAHVHKKTAACTDLLLKLKPAHIVIGALDPHFAGQGIERLQAEGLNVSVIGTNHHKNLNPWFETWITQSKPFITLKVAQSLDGKITPSLAEYQTGKRAITGRQTQTVVHNLRAQHQAILTSTKTVLEDNPLLDVRQAQNLSFSPSAPDIIVVGSRDIPKTARVFSVPHRQVHCIKKLDDLIAYCQQQKIASIMTECGGELNTQLIEAELVDQIEIFTAPIFCGKTAKPSFVKAADLKPFKLKNTQSHAGDLHFSYCRS